MTLDNSSLLLLAAPAAMLLVSLAAVWRPGPRPVIMERLSVGSGAFGIYIAAIGVALLINHGPMHSALVGWQGAGLSIQINALGMVGFSMIALLGFYLVRLCRIHLVGDPRQGAFLGRLSATIASLQLLVLTGNPVALTVAGILTALSVAKLLELYRTRLGARHLSPSARLGNPRGA